MYQKLQNLKGRKMPNYILYCSITLTIAYAYIAVLVNETSFYFNIFAEYAYIPAIFCYSITVIVAKITQYKRGEPL